MDEPANPYAAPQSLPAIVAKESPPARRVVPARRRLRFANLLIDQFAMAFFMFVVWFICVIAADDFGADGGLEFLRSHPPLFIDIVVTIGYYLLLEATTFRTIGKLITRTAVVSDDGGDPTFGQIVGRSFARMIPFEAFSFFSQERRGIHDRLARTCVVKAADAAAMRADTMASRIYRRR